MSTRQLARKWLEENHPGVKGSFRASKYNPETDIWWFTFTVNYFDSSKKGNLLILLQHKDGVGFTLLEVPYSYLRDQRSRFDVRSSRGEFDLHISAKKRNWLECERSKGVFFRSV